MTIFLTGVAGFIGSHVAEALLARGDQVVGIDNMNDYYSVDLKRARLGRLAGRTGFTFIQADVADRDAVGAALKRAGSSGPVTGIVHLAAQAGVRYSLENPYAYADANVVGQVVMLEAARSLDSLEHFVYASSSSVYGANTKLPFSIDDPVDHPVSLYAATKRAGELIAYSFSHIHKLPATGLRFFTVYGPWGRPDMAAYLFCDAIMAGRPIRVFNQGRMERDFTYIDDIVAGVVAALGRPPAPDARGVRSMLYNLGNHRSESLVRFIEVIEQALGRTALKNLEPMQAGDVPATYADIDATRRDLGFEPAIPIEVGIPRFVAWYKDYHGIA
ncbi:NAD-dependent epimerase/dehydratase family protein [Skermanella rosea]|uniref:NAD-dependent epimerase/dehydratase family protein n=1 Tax=Skermanella rosea TaxID=1817965 RepID=UPI001932657C|nr:NAD-dependent epimerase/dehydratase family protein [Skermanella rosea]UEM04410.1 NAD-dependent epimerase/dehydratase family protein [Skermanella rosea]